MMELVGWIKYAAKAVYAAITTFLSMWIAQLDGGMSQAEWLGTILATIIVVGGVFGLSNDSKPTN